MAIPSAVRPHARVLGAISYATRPVSHNAVILAACISLFAVSVSSAAVAQNVAPPVIGSSQAVTADPPVPRPSTKPIKVDLFAGFKFDNYTPQTFSYAPPKGGHWSKVVLEADFNVTKGIQFDRTASIAIGDSNIFFGTTPEPSQRLSPSWHVERDVTDFNALLKVPQTGTAFVGNTVDSTYTGVISGSADLLFYPSDNAENPPATPPDAVFALNDSGTPDKLSSASDTLSATLALPRNIVRAYLDLITQSQGNDEFWYTDVPSALASELQDTGGTAFREAEITIDGVPAGVAPVYPWIYSGGIDPYLWVPIPGVQTLDFVPYRVDLTPFAGPLDDGKPHTIDVSVFNDNNSFSVTGNLLVYQDPALAVVKGKLTQDTITAEPMPLYASNITKAPDGTVSGPVSQICNQYFRLSGYVDSSLGRVDTLLDQKVDFSNQQMFTISSSVDEQVIAQDTRVTTATTVTTPLGTAMQKHELEYPLDLKIVFSGNADGTYNIDTSGLQRYEASENDYVDGFEIFSSSLSNTVSPADRLMLNSSYVITGNADQSSSQVYSYTDSLGRVFERRVEAVDDVLTRIATHTK